MRLVLITVLLALLPPCPFAAAETRIALVIGNEDYPVEIGRLSNPHQDAEAIEDALRAANFEDITTIKDGDQAQIRLAVAEFSSKLKAAGSDGIGFFYYSGHGASTEVAGTRRNYLIPSRTNISGGEQLPILGVSLNEITDSLQASDAKAIFIVSDACRNTLPWSDTKSIGGSKGFVPVSLKPGLFIAYATADGATTPDDGIYAKALSKQIKQPGQMATRAFELAMREVVRMRPNGELPFFSPGLLEDVCFVSCDLTRTSTRSAVEPTAVEDTSLKPIIVIDAGHGGEDPGVITPDSLREKDVVLAIAKDLQKSLTNTNMFEVHLTRETDQFISLANRRRKAEALSADFLITLHADTLNTDPAANGLAIYVPAKEADRRQVTKSACDYLIDCKTGIFAQKLFAEKLDQRRTAAEGLGNLILENFRNFGMEPASSKALPSDYFELRSGNFPGVSIELGFLSNEQDRFMLVDEVARQALVISLTEALKTTKRSGVLVRKTDAETGWVTIDDRNAIPYGIARYGKRSSDGNKIDPTAVSIGSSVLPEGTKVRLINPQNNNAIDATVSDRTDDEITITMAVMSQLEFQGAAPFLVEVEVEASSLTPQPRKDPDYLRRIPVGSISNNGDSEVLSRVNLPTDGSSFIYPLEGNVKAVRTPTLVEKELVTIALQFEGAPNGNVVSPVDGTISFAGELTDEKLVLIKSNDEHIVVVSGLGSFDHSLLADDIGRKAIEVRKGQPIGRLPESGQGTQRVRIQVRDGSDVFDPLLFFGGSLTD